MIQMVLKRVFFPKITKVPNDWGLHPQTHIASGDCDTLERFSQHAVKIRHFSNKQILVRSPTPLSKILVARLFMITDLSRPTERLDYIANPRKKKSRIWNLLKPQYHCCLLHRLNWTILHRCVTAFSLGFFNISSFQLFGIYHSIRNRLLDYCWTKKSCFSAFSLLRRLFLFCP